MRLPVPALVACLLAASPSFAAQRVLTTAVDPKILAAIVDDDPNPLPRSLAPWETVPQPRSFDRGATPPAPIHTYAEYERNDGLLIRWGSSNSELTAMTVAITTATRPSWVWIVVSGTSQQSSATTTLNGAGANLARVGFITAASDSVWIRDYGPRFVRANGSLAIIDHEYNRPRPNDDNVPIAIANAWGLPRYDIPLVHGGGNFHLFATGEGFMTELIEDENPGLSTATIQGHYSDYQGLDVAIGTAFPESFDLTQHIDMWMLPVRDGVAIVGEYANSGNSMTPHAVTEAMVDDLEGRGWSVLRTPGWNIGGTHYTYANAVILDGVVLVPQYNAYPSQNATALATFAQAFPDRDIVGINATNLVLLAGVLHCIVMHVPTSPLFTDGFESGNTASWSVVVP